MVKQSLNTLPAGTYALAFYWTADASGTVTATLATQLPEVAQGMRILQCETVPGTPTPTNGYSVALKNSFGTDLMAGSMATVSNSTNQLWSASSATPPFVGAFTLVILGNSVANAQGIVVVYFSATQLINSNAGSPGPAGPAGPAGPTGPGGGGTPAANFAFSQQPGGTLTGEFAATVNITSPIQGLNGTDTNHWIYISGGTGTAEPVLITGGTYVAGANTGTIIFTPLNNHSGAWTISSATGGGAEAMQSLLTAGNGGTVLFPSGNSNFHGPLFLPTVTDTTPRYSIRGESVNATVLLVASDFPLTVTGVLTYGSFLAGNISDLTIQFPAGANSTSIGAYTHWPAAIDFTNSGVYGQVTNVDTVNAWVSVNAPSGASGFVFSNMHISGFKYGMTFTNAGFGDFIRISNVYFGPNISAVNQANNTAAFLANAIGLNVVSGFFAISNWQGFAHQYATISGGHVDITNPQMDSAGLHITGGIVNLAGGYCTLDDPAVTGTFPYCLQASGGQITVSNMNWEHSVVGTQSYVLMDGQCQLSLTNIFTDAGVFDVPFVNCTVNDSDLTVSNVTYQNTAANPAGPFISMSGSDVQLIVQSNMLAVTTNAAARIVKFTGGPGTGSVTITGNQAPGWLIDAATPLNANDTIVIGQNNGLDTIPVTIASASTITLPWGSKVFNLTGTTGVGTVNGLYEGLQVTFIPAGIVVFTAGATIGNTLTTAANVPVIGTVYSGKIYLK